MRKWRVILYSIVVVIICGSCSKQTPQECYDKGHHFYVNGEFSKAIPLYINCISNCGVDEEKWIACAYSEMAIICHLGGNNKMACEINEHGIDYFERGGLSYEHSSALCRSAVYKAYAGNQKEAVTQLRHIYALSKDSAIQKMSLTYTQILQSGELPVLQNIPSQVNVSELYCAVEMLKLELYRKPFIIKFSIVVLLFLLCSVVVYVTHSNLLYHLHDIRTEKKITQQLQEDDIRKYVTFLHDHPEDLKKELYWGNYKKMCAVVNLKMGNLVYKLSRYTPLNETETRLCVLVFIDMFRNQIADILPYAPNSIGKLKNTVSKKLGTDGKNLHNFLAKLVFSMDN